MSYKRRQLATRSDRGHNTVEAINRHNHHDGTTYPTIVAERELAEQKAEAERAKRKREREDREVA